MTRRGSARYAARWRTARPSVLIRASQDVLTLLSQDGIYMDDLRPDRARPEVWRRFAQGERGRAIAALGGIHDRSSLVLAAGRMKKDPVFRDAAHQLPCAISTGPSWNSRRTPATPRSSRWRATRTARRLHVAGPRGGHLRLRPRAPTSLARLCDDLLQEIVLRLFQKARGRSLQGSVSARRGDQLGLVAGGPRSIPLPRVALAPAIGVAAVGVEHPAKAAARTRTCAASRNLRRGRCAPGSRGPAARGRPPRASRDRRRAVPSKGRTARRSP